MRIALTFTLHVSPFSPLLFLFLLFYLSCIYMYILVYRRICHIIIYHATFNPINLAGMWANSLKADDYQGTKSFVHFKILHLYATWEHIIGIPLLGK